MALGEIRIFHLFLLLLFLSYFVYNAPTSNVGREGGNEEEEDEILLPTDYSRYEVAAGSSGAILPPFRTGREWKEGNEMDHVIPSGPSAADLHGRVLPRSGADDHCSSSKSTLYTRRAFLY